MMENVPVKIAERYKPPPQIRQHSIQLNSNRFQPNYYNESPEFQYDFQLERKVLATLPEWRRVKQRNKEARLERQEKRKIQRLRENEEQQKKLLGEVKYPSAEDLSANYENSLSSTEEKKEKESKGDIKSQDKISNETSPECEETNQEEDSNQQTVNSFNNILQPTVLNSVKSEEQNRETFISAINKNQQQQQQQKHQESYQNMRRNTSFNYKDFEEDTSSPFDNIELKTINDLDILAQVLHNTQKINLNYLEEKEENVLESEDADSPLSPESQDENPSSDAENKIMDLDKSNQLSNVNFNTLEHLLNNSNDNFKNEKNIPQFEDSKSTTTTELENNAFYKENDDLASNFSFPYVNSAKNYFAYNSNVLYNLQANQNFVISPNSNGYSCGEAYSPINSLYSLHHRNQQPQENNSHSTLTDTIPIGYSLSHNLQQRMELSESKSKSVPDIIKELGQEVTNSANRRIRNYSQNMDSKNNLLEKEEGSFKTKDYQDEEMEVLPPPNRIVRKICAMGFPHDRVNRVVQVVGEDDKKILEHLITLTDLLDLGFDEARISDALLKYDNNKEKALEYLIS